jgi:hypothetical protein
MASRAVAVCSFVCAALAHRSAAKGGAFAAVRRARRAPSGAAELGARAVGRRGSLGAQPAPGWATEHHDVSNSGRSQWDGPADADGACRFTFYEDAPFDGQAVAIYATGVTSSSTGDDSVDNSYMYGGSDNVWRMASLGNASLDLWACDFSSLAHPTGYTPATAYGIVASGVTWPTIIGTDPDPYDRLAIAGADGWLYLLNWEVCAFGRGGKLAICNRTTTSIPIVDDGATAPRTLRSSTVGSTEDVGIGSSAQCMHAKTAFPGGQPSFSPPRFLSQDVAPAITSAAGLILASETHPVLDSSGVLHAFSADNGTVLWSHSAVNGNATFGLRGVVPAIDASRGGLVLVAYGSFIRALFPANGTLAASFNAGGDPFVSSPVLTGDATGLFVVSTLGSLWKFTLSGPASALVLSTAWVKDYAVVGGVGVEVVASTARVQYVGGGWPQATTADERAALYAALEAAAPAEVRAAVQARGVSVQEAAGAHALALTPAQLNALVVPLTSHGAYYRLDGTGKPVGATASALYTSTYPYATPSLTPLDDAVVLSQFITRSGKTGLFVVSAATGAQVWAWPGFFIPGDYTPELVPFGRSRSSPAVDSVGALYVGADVDWIYPDANLTLPVLFAFQPKNYTLAGYAAGPELRWASDMGRDDGAAGLSLGSASPIVKLAAYTDQNEVFMAASDGSSGFREGRSCPTNDAALECSGYGACDCYTGTCSCVRPYLGSDCSQLPTPQPDATTSNTEAVAGAVASVAVLGAALYAFQLWRLRNASGAKDAFTESTALLKSTDSK